MQVVEISKCCSNRAEWDIYSYLKARVRAFPIPSHIIEAIISISLCGSKGRFNLIASEDPHR